MIPYFPQPVWHLGRIEIHAFGIAAALALNAGYLLTFYGARSQRLNPNLGTRLYLLIAVVGLAGSHAAFMLAHRGLDAANWLRIWSGQSAAGLIVAGCGAALACYFFLRRKGASPWPYFNVLALAIPFVSAILRAGCALAHDHLGRRTSNFLGVRFPGGTRFDLGLLQCIAGILACIIFILLARAGYRRFAPLALIAVGLTRLALLPLRPEVQSASQNFAEILVFGMACAAGLMLLTIRNQGTSGASEKAR